MDKNLTEFFSEIIENNEILEIIINISEMNENEIEKYVKRLVGLKDE